MLYARNPGGAPANVAVAAQKLEHTRHLLEKQGRICMVNFLGLKEEGSCRYERVNFRWSVFYNISLCWDKWEGWAHLFLFQEARSRHKNSKRRSRYRHIETKTNIFHVGSLSLTDQPARDTTLYAVKRAKSKGSIILWPELPRVFVVGRRNGKETDEKSCAFCWSYENFRWRDRTFDRL